MIRDLKARLERHEFLRHLLVLMSGTAVAQLLPILAYPVITRIYTPRELGIFTAFSALVAALLTVASWRYELAIVPAESDDEARTLVRLARRLSLVTCVGGGLILVLAAEPLAAFWNAPDLRLWIAGAGFVAWAYAQVTILTNWCNRKKQYAVMSQNKVGQAVTTTGAQIGLGVVAPGATGLIVGTLLGQLVAATTLFLRTRKDLSGASGSLREAARTHRKMPLLNGPTALLDTVRVNGTTMLLPAYFSAATLGQYGLAWRLLQAPAALINTSLTQVFFQRLAVTPRGSMTRLVRAAIARSAAVGAVPFALIYLLSPALFPVVFGADWAEAGLIARALVPWLFLNFITSPISMLFVVTARQGLLLWFSVPFTALPLALIWRLHDEIVATMTWLSLSMAGMLAVFLLLALWAARSYDRGAGASR